MTRRVVVYHRHLGCETGCCGHVVVVEDEHGNELDSSCLYFSHPHGEDPKTFARELVTMELGASHVADLDWESCEIYDN